MIGEGMEGPLFLLSERVESIFSRCVTPFPYRGRHIVGSQAHELGSWLA